MYFTYSKKKLLLGAESDNFLVIENRGLGYRVKFLLKDFKSDGINNIVSYGGQRLFEELPGSKSQKRNGMKTGTWLIMVRPCIFIARFIPIS
ncbi:hypothetical protein HK413_12165 [Mucilaginibacter sp. S1162]|uniref:Uncharacterized protein n=1 Tax=Mucilaginibacter humi TaxID=2732510 RepID=A0ABX1W4T6_9SPHI|nr:hypothetical protein [Mucilaginibacter humi]